MATLAEKGIALSGATDRFRRLGMVLGIVAIVCCLLVGAGAYYSSHAAIQSNLMRWTESVGESVRAHAEILQAQGRPVALALSEAWEAAGTQERGLYLCFVENNGRLSLHTRRAAMEGTDVSQTSLGEGEGGPQVKDLLETESSWSGANVNFRGFPQIVSYNYSSALGGLVTVHVPEKVIEESIRESLIPWALGFGVLTFVLFPSVLILMQIAYQRSQKAIIKVQKERDAIEKRLRQKERLDALGTFAGGVVHDINNILAVIFAGCEVLRETVDDEESSEELDYIESSANRARKLTRQLMAFSCEHPSDGEVLNPAEIACGMQGLFQTILGDEIRLRVQADIDAGSVEVARGHLEQILTDLVSNARAALPEGGRVVINVRTFVPGEQDDFHEPGPWVCLEVADNGVGIPPTVIDKVFDPFFSTRKASGGVGLGLCSVYGAVSKLGGHIWIESEEGRGTKIKIVLPKAAHCPSTSENVHGLRFLGRKRILLAEDDELVRASISKILKKEHEVTAVDCAEAAIQAFEKLGEESIDLLITDVVMPNENGISLAKKLQTRSSKLKVLLISGFVASEFGESREEDLPFDFLSKPFRASELKERIQDLFAA